jgi:hypothetical protein
LSCGVWNIVPSLYNHAADRLHFSEGALSIAFTDIYGARALLNQMHFEARFQGVEHRGANTDIERQAANPDTPHAAPLQAARQVCAIEGRITVAVRIGPLADHAGARGEFQVGMKLGAGGVLHTMDGPRAATIAKADVIRRVPIARGDDLGSALFCRLNPAIEHRNDLIACFHRQRPAGTEVVLHIDKNEGIIRVKLRQIRS